MITTPPIEVGKEYSFDTRDSRVTGKVTEVATVGRDTVIILDTGAAVILAEVEQVIRRGSD